MNNQTSLVRDLALLIQQNALLTNALITIANTAEQRLWSEIAPSQDRATLRQIILQARETINTVKTP